MAYDTQQCDSATFSLGRDVRVPACERNKEALEMVRVLRTRARVSLLTCSTYSGRQRAPLELTHSNQQGTQVTTYVIFMVSYITTALPSLRVRPLALTSPPSLNFEVIRHAGSQLYEILAQCVCPSKPRISISATRTRPGVSPSPVPLPDTSPTHN